MSDPDQIKILDGPSKFALLAQLSDIGRVSGKRPAIELELMHPQAVSIKLRAYVDGVSAEDGSGESWVFTARVAEDTLLPGQSYPDLGRNHRFSAYFHTQTREGFILRDE